MASRGSGDFYSFGFILKQDKSMNSQKSDLFNFSKSKCYVKVYYGWEDNQRVIKTELISEPKLSDFYITASIFKEQYEICYPKTFIQDSKKCILSYPCKDIEMQLPNADKWNFGFHFVLQKGIQSNVDQTESGHAFVSASQKHASVSLKELDSLEKLSEDFERLLKVDTYHDVLLKCKDVVLKCSKAVLAVRSKWFDEKFQSKQNDVIDLSHLDLNVFQEIINYIHSGKSSDLSFEMAKKLYDAGDLCEVGYLKRNCIEFLLNNLTFSNACECLAIARDDCFKVEVTRYIIENRIYSMDEYWVPFCKDHPEAANFAMNKIIKIRDHPYN